MPYYEIVFRDGEPNLELIRSLIRRVITTTPNVLAIRSLDLTYDRTARSLACNFVALSTEGEVSLPVPFVLL